MKFSVEFYGDDDGTNYLRKTQPVCALSLSTDLSLLYVVFKKLSETTVDNYCSLTFDSLD